MKHKEDKGSTPPTFYTEHKNSIKLPFTPNLHPIYISAKQPYSGL